MAEPTETAEQSQQSADKGTNRLTGRGAKAGGLPTSKVGFERALEEEGGIVIQPSSITQESNTYELAKKQKVDLTSLDKVELFLNDGQIADDRKMQYIKDVVNASPDKVSDQMLDKVHDLIVKTGKEELNQSYKDHLAKAQKEGKREDVRVDFAAEPAVADPVPAAAKTDINPDIKELKSLILKEEPGFAYGVTESERMNELMQKIFTDKELANPQNLANLQALSEISDLIAERDNPGVTESFRVRLSESNLSKDQQNLIGTPLHSGDIINETREVLENAKPEKIADALDSKGFDALITEYEKAVETGKGVDEATKALKSGIRESFNNPDITIQELNDRVTKISKMEDSKEFAQTVTKARAHSSKTFDNSEIAGLDDKGGKISPKAAAKQEKEQNTHKKQNPKEASVITAAEVDEEGKCKQIGKAIGAGVVGTLAAIGAAPVMLVVGAVNAVKYTVDGVAAGIEGGKNIMSGVVDGGKVAAERVGGFTADQVGKAFGASTRDTGRS